MKLTRTERDALGADEYHPISHKGTNLTEAGGIGYTVVDSIDTMQIMGLEEEYQRARKWVEEKLDFDRDGKFNTFEVCIAIAYYESVYTDDDDDVPPLQTTIRVLGGLLSAYTLSKDELFLNRAIDLADRILPAFDTPSGLPLSMVNLAGRVGVSDADNRGLVSTAEASTLQLEFRYLSEISGEEDYWRKAEKVRELMVALIELGSLTVAFLGHGSDQEVAHKYRSGVDIHEVSIVNLGKVYNYVLTIGA